MKLFKLCLFFIPFFISCSSSVESEEYARTVSTPSMMERASDTVANVLNPYDYVGAVHYSILEQYSLETQLATGNEAVIGRVLMSCKSDPYFLALNPTEFQVSSVSSISYIVANPLTSQAEIIGNTLEGSLSKSLQTDFIQSLLSVCDSVADYASIYRFICSYEQSVLHQNEISAADLKTILISTSIARYSIYERKKKPKKNTDPEWAMLVGNIWAGMDGIMTGAQEAIFKASAVYLLQNK